VGSIHPTAVVSSEAKLGANIRIAAYVVIGSATIGDGCVIHPHVTIGNDVRLGGGVEVFPGAVIGKEPASSGAMARVAQGAGETLIGDGCSIGPHAVIYFDVEIGAGSLIGDGASIREQCRIGQQCLISRGVTINYNTVVGDRTKVMDGTHLTGNMWVDADVFISTMVATTNDNRIRGGYGDHVVGPKIHRHAIVGAGAILLPATTIGEGAVVAAGAVVTRDVAPGVTVMGAPARVVERTAKG